MTAQLDIFADARAYPEHPGFKSAGPSHEAAKAAAPRAPVLREGVLACLALCPMTPEQVAARLGVDILGLRPRFTELKLAGKIEKTDARGPSRGGLSATVWRLVR